ncbi:MAG: 1-deoxy-D-xylulose-5-phosphate synthase [Tissierellia bacterium]|nr:1-deoxy-D-xylulose-5-phosphate synthase [Tissierellia bacterium]
MTTKEALIVEAEFNKKNGNILDINNIDSQESLIPKAFILNGILSPADIKQMPTEQLVKLAEEIRDKIIKITSKQGGHLSSNLGVVELALALHNVFDAPEDIIIWDVGHQTYVHKLITGRNIDFDSLRTYGGISGFPRRVESSYDAFGTGHASTSISAATGFALARDLAGNNNHVIAVIGDGAMTGGMAFEAMNHAGSIGLDLKIILNDNEMSIDSNTSGIHNHLLSMRKKAESDGTKLSSGFFEAMGFQYFGPVDGHNLQDMTSVFKSTKNIRGPVVIHCITKKGKGYAHAENNPQIFHGVGPFNVKTGERNNASDELSYTDIFAKTLITLGKEDERICAITAAMGLGTGVSEFQKVFPNRVFDVGIAEEHATTLAAALALSGMKPVLAIYSTFMQRGFDQLIHDCAIQNTPVVVALDRSGIVGEDGATHHGVFDLSYLRMIPNITVMAPKDEQELQNMLFSAFKYNSLVAIRYPRGKGPGTELSNTFEYLEKGKGEWVCKGNDVVLIAVGSMVSVAEAASRQLKNEGIDVGVVNARFVKPLDEKLLEEVFSDSKRVMTIEDNVIAGGFGSAVIEWAINNNFYTPIRTLGIPDTFIEHGAKKVLHKDLGLDVDGVVREIKSWIQQNIKA